MKAGKLTRSGVLLFTLSVLLYAAATGTAQVDEWRQYASPEEAGFSSAKLEQAYNYAREIGSAAVMAVYKGHVLVAWGQIEANYMCHSVRKSLLSALYGILAAEGRIDVGKTLAELGIDDEPPLSEQEKTATARHLLQSRSGIYHDSAYYPQSWRDNIPERGTHKPGDNWYYNNWDFNTLGAIFVEQTGEDIFGAFESRIADQIGMEDFDPIFCNYHLEPGRSRHAAYPFRVSARDLARFGLLFARGGRWGDTQVVPESWVRESTRSYSVARGDSGYGYMWWVYEPEWLTKQGAEALGRYGFFGAEGAGGHKVWVSPEADLVFVHRVDTDRGKNIQQGARVFEAILAAREGEPKAEPQLKPVEATPFAGQPTAVVPLRPIEADIAEYAGFLGRYEIESEQFPYLEIKLDGGRMLADLSGRYVLEILPCGETEFFLRGTADRLVFERGEKGEVRGVGITLDDQPIRGVKKE